MMSTPYAKAFILLLFAIACEIIATAALKASDGFTRPLFATLVVVGYGLSFYFLGFSIKEIPLGMVYALWSGIGTVGAVIVGVLIWREGLDLARIIGMLLIIIGVVVLQLFSEHGPA